ncbi:MAG: hemerythrin domain-containing protein, partial [Gammaproteobacteria bacterium]|nr:hemerythrin domain-containing protein [Gammaproteobacteria bacterium]
MTSLVSDLKNEHDKIVGVFGQIEKHGISSDEGRKLLLSIKSELLQHLEKEDEQLYPVLFKEAETDSLLSQDLDRYSEEIHGLYKEALDFFDKYSSNGKNIEFAQDFRKLFSIIAFRIYKGESIFYKK